MADGSLSQDEIDALLKDTDDLLPPSSSSGGFSFGGAPKGGSALSPVERDALGEIMSGVMGTVAPSLSGYLQRDISITNAFVEVKNQSAASEFAESYFQFTMGYTGGLNGQNIVLVNLRDASIIAGLMLGTDGASDSFDDAQMSTMQEFVSALVSAAATQLGSKVGGPVSTTPPNISVATSASDIMFPPGDFVKITYNISIGGSLNSRMFHLMDLSLASSIAKSAGSRGGASSQFSQQPHMQPQQQMGSVGISAVKFPPLTGSGMPELPSNIELIMDVQLTLTVELGRTTALVKDILGYGEGSIIELDKLAGEPVDLLVNGKLIAKGEVVVIDENFGVRVTDIVSPSERLTKMGNM